jgi:hypothetical protein
MIRCNERLAHATAGVVKPGHRVCSRDVTAQHHRKGGAMPCGDNRILTAFFDYLADRAVTLRPTGTVGAVGSRAALENAAIAEALAESRPVFDVLHEIATLLDIDDQPLRTMAAHLLSASGVQARSA